MNNEKSTNMIIIPLCFISLCVAVIANDTVKDKELLLLEIEETQLKIELLRKQCDD